MPGDQAGAVGITAARKSSSAIPAGSAETSAAEPPSANSRNEQHRFDIRRFLKMQGAQFQVDHQHPRRRIGRTASRAARKAGTAAEQPMKPTCCAHVRPQAEPRGELQVEPGGGETGAGGDDQMGDARPFRLDAESPRRRARRAPAPASGTAPCGRRCQGTARAGKTHRRPPRPRQGCRPQERQPVCDAGALGHAVEHLRVFRSPAGSGRRR